ncbi:prepilin-type N-terminal cleavage/methylation domain-containing protein [Candidatus Sumerlaeota bacterium]|nr:prepilin-type N-terminal cleavage/methylation domain-containing protein [Candidatus Sumerlaeota bacterium]
MKRFTKLFRTGFTLIELLIVVAIIAIIASIAVPNFLEAQARSKVSKAMGDMRSLAVGLESYMLDNNHYPFQAAVTPLENPSLVVMPIGAPGVSDPQDSMHGSPQKRYNKFIPYILTTPVSYLSSLPIDPFATRMIGPYPASRYYFYNNLDDSIKWMLTDGGKTLQQITNMTHKRELWGVWTLISNGPDLDRLDIEGETIGLNLKFGYYDPTNGTISNGDILRAQKEPAPHK